jgi:hypothetical protein
MTERARFPAGRAAPAGTAAGIAGAGAWWALGLAAALAASGCKSSHGAEVGAAGSAGAPPGAPRAPSLALDLGLTADERALTVEIRVTGPEAAKVRSLRATRGWAGTRPLAAVKDLEVRDAAGPIPVGAPADQGAFSVLPLGRPAAGDEVIVRYTARADAASSRLSLHRGAGGVSGVGHGFVVRPAVDAALPLSVRFRAEALGSAAALATSLDGRADASVEDLAEAVYVAGAVQPGPVAQGDRATIAFGAAIDGGAGPVAQGDRATIAFGAAIDGGAAQPGPVSQADRATIAFGAAIDGGAALDVAARARSFAARAFGLDEGAAGGRVQLFVIGERAIGREHDGAATGGAIAVWLDAARSLDDGAKILIAHEALHRVFGGALRVGIEGYEATWFSEGFATHYARRSLFDAGAIEADAFAADVARIDDRAERAGPADRRDAEYGRGARYAALVDAAVRSRSRGARSLDDVVRALAALAKKAPDAPISVDSFRALVAAEVGEEKERALFAALASKDPPELPDDAFGPCFGRAEEKRTVVELGFDPTSLSSAPQIIRGTVPGSEAARAGVTDGALVLRSNLRPGQELDPTFRVELVLSDPKGKKTVRYPAGATRKKTVFKPRPCVKK